MEIHKTDKDMLPMVKLDHNLKNATQAGLYNPRAILFLLLWYIFSAGTLFLNKYVLSYKRADPHVLCGSQLFITMCCGLFHLKFPLGTYKQIFHQTKPPDFMKNMVVIGIVQFGTILFSLMTLYFVAVSFAETVKSSAPIFTLLIARYVLGERQSFFVTLSLFPVMLGLALCSSHELSFNFPGFFCAMGANLCECVQNVLSKSLFSDKMYSYNPAELQFYSNLAAIFFQFPMWPFLVNFPNLYEQLDGDFILSILLSGICFHGQTMTAYVLITYINTVTYSVANTTKRAFLIWLSILLFGNPVSFFSGLGTIIVILGVLLYNKAREIDARRRLQFSIIHEKMDDYR